MILWFGIVTGRWMEAEQDKLLSGGLAGDRECAWTGRCHLYHVTLSNSTHGIAAQNELQSTRAPKRGENERDLFLFKNKEKTAFRFLIKKKLM